MTSDLSVVVFNSSWASGILCAPREGAQSGSISCKENFPLGTGRGTMASKTTTYFVVRPWERRPSGNSMTRNRGARSKVSTDHAAHRETSSALTSCSNFKKVTFKLGRSSGSDIKLSTCMTCTRLATSSSSSTSALAQIWKPLCAGYSVCSNSIVGMPFCLRPSWGSTKSTEDSSNFK